jgi:hypothetical protein
METDFDSSIPRDMAWGTVMRPMPLPEKNKNNNEQENYHYHSARLLYNDSAGHRRIPIPQRNSSIKGTNLEQTRRQMEYRFPSRL